MSDTYYSLRLDETLKRQFSKAAKQSGHSGADLLREYMREVVRQHEAQGPDADLHHQVQIGLNSANTGNTLPAAEVEARFAVKRAATRRRLQVSD